MQTWLTDLRKTALLAAVAAIVQLLLLVTSPVTFAQFARAKNGLNHPGYAYAAFAFAGIIGLLASWLVVGFLITLYRTKTVVQIPDRLRVVAWFVSAAAICLTIWSRQFYFTQAGLPYLRSPVPLARFVLALASDLVTVLFLVAIATQPGEAGGSEALDDRMLRRYAKIGTIIWGVILVGVLWATAYTVYYYRSMQRQYFQNLEAYVPLSKLLGEKLRQFLQQAIVFTPFFMVHRGFVERRRLLKTEAPVPDASEFDTPERPADQA